MDTVPIKINGSDLLSSITRGPRQSNFELLRIVAMLLVLVVHTNYFTLGEPSVSDLTQSPLPSLSIIFFQSLSIICVNVFILISGWFQIRPTLKGGISFIFQCLWMSVIVMAGAYFLGAFEYDNIKELLILLSRELLFNYNGFWFIKAYLVLYIFSPVLNTFLGCADKRTITITLLCFFILQSIWSPLLHFRTGFFNYGYSPLSFMGLYLLANTVRRFYSNYTMKQACALFFAPLFLLFAIATASCWFDISLPYEIFAYSDPLVICESLGLTMIFARLKIAPNKFINWIAASAFAVYLFHINPLVIPVYQDILRKLYNHTSGVMTIAVIFGFILIVFVAAVLLDQPRRAIWRCIKGRTGGFGGVGNNW